MNSRLTSNKPTHYLLDHGNFENNGYKKSLEMNSIPEYFKGKYKHFYRVVTLSESPHLRLPWGKRVMVTKKTGMNSYVR